MRTLVALLLLGGQDVDPRKARALVDTLEARLAATAPFTADYRFSTVKPGGAEEPGSSMSVFANYSGGVFDVQIRKVELGAPEPLLLNSILENGRFATWNQKGEGHRADYGELFDKIRAACNRCGRELEELLPSTPENPAMALPRGVSLILHVDTQPESAEPGFRVSLSFPGAPGSWLELIRRADDAVIKEGKERIDVHLPSRRSEIAIERSTGLLLEYVGRDADGGERRIARTRYAPGVARLGLTPPEKLKPPPFGMTQGYLSGYAAVFKHALRRLRAGWSRLAGREEKAVERMSGWAALYVDLLAKSYFEELAERYVQARLAQGATVAEMEARIPDETRAMRDVLLRDGDFTGFWRRSVERMLAGAETEPAEDAFFKAAREALSPERLKGKIPQLELLPLLRDALRRAREL